MKTQTNTPLIWNRHSLSQSFFLEDYSFKEIILKTLENDVKLGKTHTDKYRVLLEDIAP